LTHERNRTHVDRRSGRRALALQTALAALASCTTERAPVASIWPPPDFRVALEERAEEDGHSFVHRRFTVGADGVCVYARAAAADALADAETGTQLPVFRTLCVYRLLDVSTRLLARKLHKRGVLDLDPVQGDQHETLGRSLRLSYRAFANERTVVASGQIHGAMARVLRVINTHVPRGEEFLLPGVMADAEPQTLIGVPAPVDDLQGALACHLDLLGDRPEDPELLLDAFALACRAGDRGVAESLLQRWVAATRALEAAAPFSDVPQLTPELLRRLLPH
jgi:hypothetical protein